MEPEKVREIIESLQQALPPIFLGSRADELTGGVVCWGTVQNKRSRREIPDEVFYPVGGPGRDHPRSVSRVVGWDAV